MRKRGRGFRPKPGRGRRSSKRVRGGRGRTGRGGIRF